MATVFDVDNVEVIQDSESLLSYEVPLAGEIAVTLPGPQGEPGLKNVYTQLANPALEYGWGMDEKGHIWIEVDV